MIYSSSALIGKKGLNSNRHEGDMTTPIGVFDLLFQFGSAPNPGVKMNYRQTFQGDYWSSVQRYDEYNTWVKYKGDPKLRFGNDYEDLFATIVYKYAIAIDFNYNSNKIIGKGSAIFMHLRNPDNVPTLGCISLYEENLLDILKWLDPVKNPKIVIGTEDYLKSFKNK